MAFSWGLVRLALVIGEARLSLVGMDRGRPLTGQVVKVITDGEEELNDVGIPSASEAEVRSDY